MMDRGDVDKLTNGADWKLNGQAAISLPAPPPVAAVREPRMRGKFQCIAVEQVEPNSPLRRVRFAPWGVASIDESERLTTPDVRYELTMFVDNRHALRRLKPGVLYFLEITPVADTIT